MARGVVVGLLGSGPRGRRFIAPRRRTDSPEVEAANAGNGRLRVRGSGAWKRGDDFERLVEFLGEHVGVVAIGQPPGFFCPNMSLRSGREANAAILQRDRSSRRITSASTRRPALMSSSE